MPPPYRLPHHLPWPQQLTLQWAQLQLLQGWWGGEGYGKDKEDNNCTVMGVTIAVVMGAIATPTRMMWGKDGGRSRTMIATNAHIAGGCTARLFLIRYVIISCMYTFSSFLSFSSAHLTWSLLQMWIPPWPWILASNEFFIKIKCAWPLKDKSWIWQNLLYWVKDKWSKRGQLNVHCVWSYYSNWILFLVMFFCRSLVLILHVFRIHRVYIGLIFSP